MADGESYFCAATLHKALEGYSPAVTHFGISWS
jgi:hypothetical protein